MNVNCNLNKHLLSIVVSFGLIALAGCESSAVKREPIAPAVDEAFTPAGHILLKPEVEDIAGIDSKIPTISAYQPANIPNLNFNENEIYSITAVNVPVNELLFKLAQDANKEIDIYSGVGGLVTINAINQPLDSILKRISEQLGFVYVLKRNQIVIKPDYPEWRSYKIDYVNITKTSTESIDMQMSVSSSTDGAATVNNPSTTSVKVESKHLFWENLKQNIEILAQVNPLDAFREEFVQRKMMNDATAKGNGATTTNSPVFGDSVASNGDFQASQKSALSSKISVNTLVNPEAGMIAVYATDARHKEIKKYIDEVVNRVERQVFIEATVVEVELNDTYQAGIDWDFVNTKFFGNNGGITLSSPFSGPSNGFSIGTIDPFTSGTGPFKTGNWDITSNIKLLSEFGDSKVLSSPKIMAINNQTALLKVVKNLVYFTVEADSSAEGGVSQTTYTTEIHSLPVGFTMSVTPFVTDSDEVILNVRPTISKKVDSVKDPNPSLTVIQSEIPVIQEKEMSSVLRLRNKQTAVIGGLIEDYNANLKTGTPGVSEIPFFGDLFSVRDDNANKKELVIFIRPIIVENPDIDAGDLKSVAKFLKTQPLPKKPEKKINTKEVIPVDSVDIFEEFPE